MAAPRRVESPVPYGGTSLPVLVRAAAAERWAGSSTDALMAEVERRVVDAVPSRLVRGLGRDEARQVARVVAWERLRQWLLDAETNLDRIGWGYLANVVRWRVTDAFDRESRRHARHMPTAVLPDSSPYCAPAGDPASRDVDHALGEHLDVLVDALVGRGMSRRDATCAVHVACDDSDLRRDRVIARLERHSGLDARRAGALADLLLGHRPSGVESVVARLAAGEPWRRIGVDPAVRQRLACVAAAQVTCGLGEPPITGSLAVGGEWDRA